MHIYNTLFSTRVEIPLRSSGNMLIEIPREYSKNLLGVTPRTSYFNIFFIKLLLYNDSYPIVLSFSGHSD